MTRILIVFVLIPGMLHSQARDKVINDLKNERQTYDTCFVYSLPFTQGSKYLLVQGYNSRMSHRGEVALDFKMRKGSIICAARAGVVEDLKEDSNARGLKNKYISLGNHVIIRHSDGSRAEYWHLRKDGVTVKKGQRVHRGMQIGISGNTGYSAFPHLHFQVYDINGRNIPTRFHTRKGKKYLRPGKWYKRVEDFATDSLL